MKNTVHQLPLIGAFAVCTLISLPATSQEAASPAAAPPPAPITEAAAAVAAPVPAPAPAPAEAAPINEPALAADSAPATEPTATAAEPVPTRSSSGDNWLSEVQAQRKAQRERMAQAREERQSAYPASPWGEDMEAYRETMRNRAAMYQENMRARRRWMNPRAEYIRDMQEMRRNAMQAQAETMRQQWEKMRQQNDPWTSADPYGWNNPWYFQGY